MSRLYIVTLLFNLYAENIMGNAGLDEAQAGIKIAKGNINNLRYADDTTLMAESEEELKSLSMKVKEESEKVGLKLNIDIPMALQVHRPGIYLLSLMNPDAVRLYGGLHPVSLFSQARHIQPG